MLKTPVQFEPAFDGLNEVRPLKLADRVKINLDLPVCNVNPVSSSRRAAGKLLRCNNLGGMLKNSGHSFENVLYRDCQLFPGVPNSSLDVIEGCKGVSAIFTGGGGMTEVYWVDSPLHIFMVEIANEIMTWLPFTGSRMYFYGKNIVGGYVRVKTYSFN